MIWPFYNYYYAKKLLFIIFLFHNVYWIIRLKLNSGLKKIHRSANHSFLKKKCCNFIWLVKNLNDPYYYLKCKYTLLSKCFYYLFMWGLDEKRNMLFLENQVYTKCIGSVLYKETPANHTSWYSLVFYEWSSNCDWFKFKSNQYHFFIEISYFSLTTAKRDFIIEKK